MTAGMKSVEPTIIIYLHSVYDNEKLTATLIRMENYM